MGNMSHDQSRDGFLSTADGLMMSNSTPCSRGSQSHFPVATTVHKENENTAAGIDQQGFIPGIGKGRPAQELGHSVQEEQR